MRTRGVVCVSLASKVGMPSLAGTGHTGADVWLTGAKTTRPGWQIMGMRATLAYSCPANKEREIIVHVCW